MVEFAGVTPDAILDVGRARPQLSVAPDSWIPIADVYELGDELVIEIELPGSQNDTITTNVVTDEATIESQQAFHIVVEGHREPVRDATERFHNERWQGGFARLFRVPVAYDESKVKADYNDGLLRIAVAKKPDQSLQLTPILEQLPKNVARKPGKV